MITDTNRKNIKWTALISFCLLLMTGCTTPITPPAVNTQTTSAAPPSQTAWQERKAALERIDRWRLSGKIAVQTAKDSGSATVEWSQNHGHYNVALSGPMGSHNMKLSGSPGHVTLVTSDGKTASAGSPEQLLAQRWGFRLPVSSLVYWVRGLPVPGKNYNSRFDNKNRLVLLNQEGWSIQYQNYGRYRNMDLPTRLYIYSSSLKTKIIIYQWQI